MSDRRTNGQVASASRSAELSVDGCPIVYAEMGIVDAPILMLLHCGGGNAAWWNDVASSLAHRRRLIIPELSGHGKSGHRKKYTPAIWANEVRAIAKAVSNQRIAIAGHSMGALVAIYAAAQYREIVNTLILIDPPVQSVWKRHVPPRSRTYRSKEEAIARFRLRPPETLAAPSALRRIAEGNLQETDSGWMWRYDPRASQRFDVAGVKAALENIKAPVGCIRGGQSQFVTDETIVYIEKVLSRPVETVVIAEAFHHVPLDAPEQLATAIDKLAANEPG